MRDIKRISLILEALKILWEKYPDMRFGQLLINLPFKSDPYYMEDDKMLEFLKNVEF